MYYSEILKIPMKGMGKARPRVTSRGTFMPRKYVDFKQELYIRAFGQGWNIYNVPSALDIEFCFKLPSKLRKQEKIDRLANGHQQKPDLDNLIGTVMDALIPEDQKIHEISAKKRWTEDQNMIIIRYNIP